MLKQVKKINEDVLGYLKSSTILCIEDDLSTNFIYEAIFKDSIKTLIFAENGEDGYKAYLENDVDIIITDYFMPKLNGIEMIKKIRKKDSKIPIILVSSIEDLDVIKSAIGLHIHNFIEKPVKTSRLVDAVINCSKVLIADKFLEEQRKKKIQDLEEKEKYNSYQEDLAFSKELNILKNDFYYQMINQDYAAMVDFMYKPLDVLSGDAYSARKIDEGKIFFLIVDGMGKGISASLSAILFTTFTNHIIDISDEFDFNNLIYDSIEYIKPILLDEETLSVDYVMLNYQNKEMQYAKFSMPSSLVQQENNEIIKIKSNNPPISKYTKKFKISTFDTSKSIKFLFYSDGIVENETRFDGKLYANYIENDFLNSFVKEDMKEKLLWKIQKQEDDMTFIFFNKLDLKDSHAQTKTFSNTLAELENSNEWYTQLWEDMTNNHSLIYSAGVVFTELMMNAYEHGNLGIDTQKKHKMLEDDTYLDSLQAMELVCNKKIIVYVNKVDYMDNTYIITKIIDDGDGFDTNILSKIFRNKALFNGRGVFVSRRSSLGLYYNQKGNEVLFLHKLEK